jgi:hypothetical protein
VGDRVGYSEAKKFGTPFFRQPDLTAALDFLAGSRVNKFSESKASENPYEFSWPAHSTKISASNP